LAWKRCIAAKLLQAFSPYLPESSSGVLVKYLETSQDEFWASSMYLETFRGGWPSP